MRLYSVFLAVTAAVTLGACTHTETTTPAFAPVTVTQTSTNSVTSSSGTYAVAKPIPSGATIKPSSECAESFDDVISYLEHLMEQKQGQQVASATPSSSRVSKRVDY